MVISKNIVQFVQ